MYHDTIHINFKHYGAIGFDYSFLISKNEKDKFAPILYGDLMQKFDEIGFDLKYLKFNDISDQNTIVYCTYNYQPNFNIFFTAYKKLIIETNFNLTFEYGNIISGKFYPNNMNYFAGVFFVAAEKVQMNQLFREVVIRGKSHHKSMELYQIIDKTGNAIFTEVARPDNDFEQHFFENYGVKVALRKFKLNQLKNKFEEN